MTTVTATGTDARPGRPVPILASVATITALVMSSVGTASGVIESM